MGGELQSQELGGGEREVRSARKAALLCSRKRDSRYRRVMKKGWTAGLMM